MATYEGMGLCESKEYHDAFSARLDRDEITRGELYVARFKIDGLKVGFRVLGRIGLTSVATAQNTELDFQILNDDMQPLDIPPEGNMIDGVWNSEDGIIYQNRPGVKYYDMRDGCFAHYEEGDGWALYEEIQLFIEHDLETSLSRELATPHL